MRAASARAAFDRAECSAFQAFPSSATVRSSPVGMKIGSYPKPSSPRGSRATTPSSVPPAPSLGPVGAERDELADVPCTPIVDAVELRQQTPDVIGGPASRVDPRPPSERLDLDPRVLARNPRVGRSVLSPMRSLDPCVLDEGRAVLDRLVFGVTTSSTSQPGRAARSSRSLFGLREARSSLKDGAPRQLRPARR